ncbi:hypothetical protein EVAR_9908_1 [Eumeta japonica]|uniref:Uncharacterized protein n=1 Tax=Eumeta variegata TaxID=151549 RepID=A0A4C1TQD5_EUMVA|nr:hypothetical protein EVAR_9908_1 [Eumeta japonica]
MIDSCQTGDQKLTRRGVAAIRHRQASDADEIRRQDNSTICLFGTYGRRDAIRQLSCRTVYYRVHVPFVGEAKSADVAKRPYIDRESNGRRETPRCSYGVAFISR